MNVQNKFLYCSPKVSVGERFKFTVYNRKDITIIDLYGYEHFFEDARRIVMEVVDFFSGEQYEYKIRFFYDGQVMLSKWYFESEIVSSLENKYIYSLLEN